ncbi:ribonuclease HII [Candidatus Cloacimonadota bacterium]
MLFSNQIRDFGVGRIAGIDEAGRGPLAGPVVVAGVILDPDKWIPGLDDSKKLTSRQRDELYDIIIREAIDWKIEIISEKIIDDINILQASLLGMKLVAESIDPAPDLCLMDGNFLPRDLNLNAKAVVKGDSIYASIAAASILAKVTRDRIMLEMHEKFPQYNFASNKGYPTPEHLTAIRKFGVIEHHRRSFNPVKQLEFDF